jgi:uncharacterized protein YutE (UPF0331/DUF86 family)
MSDMTNFSYDEKINKYLIELADEYRELLYKRLIENNKGFDELSISELLRLDNEIKKPLIERRNSRINILYRVMFMGILYIIIGFFWFLYVNMDMAIRLDSRELAPLLIMFMGVTISLLSFFVYKIRLNKNRGTRTKNFNLEKDISFVEHKIITMWRDIDGIASDLTSDNTEIQDYTPIDKLKSDELINGEEINSLKELLSLRNKIMHERNEPIDFSNSFDVIEKCNGILNKLKKIL